LVDTRTLVRCPLVLALVPALYPEVGKQAPALVPNPEIGRLIQGAKPLSPTMGLIQTLDQHTLHHRFTIGGVPRLVQATTRVRTIGIVTEIRVLSGPLAPLDATHEAVTIARGKETGTETARGGTLILGIIRTLINHRPHEPGVTPAWFFFGPTNPLPASSAPSPYTSPC